MSNIQVASVIGAILFAALIVVFGVQRSQQQYKEGYVVEKIRTTQSCVKEERVSGTGLKSTHSRCTGPDFSIRVEARIPLPGSVFKDKEFYTCPVGYALYRALEKGQYFICPRADYVQPLWQKTTPISTGQLNN